jgi:hypothetical protein
MNQFYILRSHNMRRLTVCFASALCLLPFGFTSAAEKAANSAVTVHKLPDGAWELVEGRAPILRYNYQIVREPEAIKKLVAPGNRIYAVDRCDYIHPLYGLHGETLTEDWPKDHPHHRGIYWAWPEVDWRGQRGDLHALQKVFARPTGKIRAVEKSDFAQIEAENQWCWNGTTPIVREEATLRAWRQTAAGRRIDFEFRFTAIDADVQVARRAQSHYGGLNLRFGPLAGQKIETFTDRPGTTPCLTWAQRSGKLADGRSAAMVILQDPRNADYPGDWVQYPQLSWIQPTFPAAGTRWTITKAKPLTLRFRLWLRDEPLSADALRKLCAEF